jgi:hypothetical protein
MADVVQHGPTGSHRPEAVRTSLSAGSVVGWISVGLALSIFGAFLVVITVGELGWGSLSLYGGLLFAVAVGVYGRGGRQLGLYSMGVVISLPCLFVALLFFIGH